MPLGRPQIYNNWRPSMVSNPSHVWLGLAHFRNDSDAIWNLSAEDMAAMATEEPSGIGIIDSADVIDSTVSRMEETCPAFFGAFDRFAEVRQYVDCHENLFLVDRNGLHHYSNQDHSMLTAMMAVEI